MTPRISTSGLGHWAYQLQSPSLAEKDTKLHFQHVSQNFRHAAAELSATKPFVSALQSPKESRFEMPHQFVRSTQFEALMCSTPDIISS